MDTYQAQRVQSSLSKASRAIGNAPFEMQVEAEALVDAATAYLNAPSAHTAQAYEDADARYNSAAIECGWL